MRPDSRTLRRWREVSQYRCVRKGQIRAGKCIDPMTLPAPEGGRTPWLGGVNDYVKAIDGCSRIAASK